MGVCSKVCSRRHRETFADLNKQTKLDSLELTQLGWRFRLGALRPDMPLFVRTGRKT